jgi:hypothetical protein
MPATVQIQELNTVGATQTDKTTQIIRFKNADNATVDTVNPMVKPTSGTDWSFKKWLAFNVTAGTYTSITNIRTYSDGSNGWTGVKLFAKAATSTFSTPAEETSTAGYADFFGYTANGALTVGGAGGTTYSSTGIKGNYVEMAMEVYSTAGAGTLAGETMTWAYDEI